MHFGISSSSWKLDPLCNLLKGWSRWLISVFIFSLIRISLFGCCAGRPDVLQTLQFRGGCRVSMTHRNKKLINDKYWTLTRYVPSQNQHLKTELVYRNLNIYQRNKYDTKQGVSPPSWCSSQLKCSNELQSYLLHHVFVKKSFLATLSLKVCNKAKRAKMKHGGFGGQSVNSRKVEEIKLQLFLRTKH